MSDFDSNILNLDFAAHNKATIPQPWESTERTDTRFVTFGKNNLYPNFLLDLYTDSSLHSSIINTKSFYIQGKGLHSKDNQSLQFKVNAEDSLSEFLDKIIKDYLLFNAMAVELIFAKDRSVHSYNHVPVHLIRLNKSKSKIWYKEDWRVGSANGYIVYERYNGAADAELKSKIFYFDGYFPSLEKTYAKPEYIGLVKAILADIALSDLNLNSIKTSFSPSTVITFFNGNPTEETKKQTARNITGSYTGELGRKVIVDYQNPTTGKPAVVNQLGANNWFQEFLATHSAVKDEIVSGHQITSSALVAFKTAGQLGNTQELQNAYEIFLNTYVSRKRSEIISALKMLFAGDNRFPTEFAFVDIPLFSKQISDTLKEKIMTINELRKEGGLPAIQGGDRLIEYTSPVSPAPTVPVVQQKNFTEERKPTFTQSQEDFDKIAHFGSLADEYEILSAFDDKVKLKFGTEEDISQYIIENDIQQLTISELNKLLAEDIDVNVSERTLKSILKKLNDSGIVKVEYDNDGKLNVTPNPQPKIPDTDEIQVMYKYEKRPEVTGDVLLPTSRPFCKALINNRKMYTRAELQQMAGLFGYDVYQFTGGFYYNPNTEKLTPFCRHRWVAYSVKKRGGNNG